MKAKIIIIKILVIVLLFFSGCATKKVIAPLIEYSDKTQIVPVEADYDPETKIYKITFDGIVMLFRYADFDFLNERFSFIVSEKKIFSNTEINCVPFYILQKNKVASAAINSKRKASDEIKSENNIEYEEKYQYKTGVTPFYISIKNNNSNKVYMDIDQYAVIVDSEGRQYATFDYSELQKFNLQNTYRVRRKTNMIRTVFSPIFKYTGISFLTDAIASTPAAKLSLFNVSVNDVTKTVTQVNNIFEYKYHYPFPENLMFKTKNIYPTVIENGFIVFPAIPNDVENLTLILSDIITKFNDDGTPAKAMSVSIPLRKELFNKQ